MKKTTNLLLAALMIFSFSQSSEAQIWKRIKKKAEDAIVKKSGKEIDDVVNGKKKDSDGKKEGESLPQTEENQTVEQDESSPEIWRNYKFIPGEKVIFYDDLKYEEVGEFPARWDLLKGGAEIARFNGEKVIITTDDYFNTITPLFDNKSYLSDEFTIELDIYVEGSDASNYWTEIIMELVEEGGNKAKIELQLDDGKTTSGYIKSSNFPLESVEVGALNDWHHIAISYYKGKTKIYYDDKRIGNLPKLGIAPNSFKFGFRGYASGKNGNLNSAVKNIRIAHGGGQMYKRIVADGKYVTNGILFDSGNATIKSQSMGVINKIVTVMKEYEEFKFEIIGHTDSDGSTEDNQTLSKQRADAVKQVIVSLGISEDRLTTLGKGESESLNTNSTSEEKANNRRVEFILKK